MPPLTVALTLEKGRVVALISLGKSAVMAGVASVVCVEFGVVDLG